LKLTNNLGLPRPIVEAVMNDPYSKGKADFSVTELIKPPRIRQLEIEYGDKIVEDVSDRLYSLTGQAMHSILERAAEKSTDIVVEKRFFTDIVGGLILSGQVDCLEFSSKDDYAILSDYKNTSLGAVMYGIKEEWTSQVNLNAYLARRNGILVRAGQIVAIFRDWNKREAKRRAWRGDWSYPQRPAGVYPIKLWTDEECEGFIEERIRLHTAQFLLPTCTEKERWAMPTKWAVKKKGGKRAVNGGVFNYEEEAMQFVDEADYECEIEHRPGESVRCADYCSVAQFCEQWKNDPTNPENK
jgi:hypothetical protein